MSRVGKQIIAIPNGVEISVSDGIVKVKSSKGELRHQVPDFAKVNVKDSELTVDIADPEDRLQNVLWGTTTSIIGNMVQGVDKGFSKQLEVNGVGYKVSLSGKKLTLNLGFSHPIDFTIPEHIDAEVEKNLITIKGIDKQQVGQVAAQIRKFRPPEPYKGKGIRYIDEVVRRKVGKAAVGSES